MVDDNLKKVLSDLSIVDKICDTVRLVDPIMKKVISFQGNNVKTSDFKCFDFWNKNKACNNCISMRAFNDNKTYIKLEYTGTRIFMITAIAADMQDRRVVVEMMKDTTDSMSLGLDMDDGRQKEEIYALIDNMNNLALKDSLTGIYNRRYINEKLPVDLINSAFLSQGLSIIIADIDYFKNVNDAYGHLAGDYVIKTFAETLTSCIKRTSDWIARFGGEEFLVCLPGADLKRAVTTAETMRKAVEKKVMTFDRTNIEITASFGVYCEKNTVIDNIEPLIQHADEKLYLAKQNGRNRVEY